MKFFQHPKPRSPHWPFTRALHLKEEPACRACGTKWFLEVHHIKSFREYPELELVDANLITLCRVPFRNCHFNIGHHRNWSWSNPNVEQEADDAYEATRGQLEPEG